MFWIKCLWKQQFFTIVGKISFSILVMKLISETRQIFYRQWCERRGPKSHLTSFVSNAASSFPIRGPHAPLLPADAPRGTWETIWVHEERQVLPTQSLRNRFTHQKSQRQEFPHQKSQILTVLWQTFILTSPRQWISDSCLYISKWKTEPKQWRHRWKLLWADDQYMVGSRGGAAPPPACGRNQQTQPNRVGRARVRWAEIISGPVPQVL